MSEESEVRAIWQSLVVEIGNSIYQQVNTPETVGTDRETGYALMFFNVKGHNGKSTFISSELDKTKVKKLLREIIRGIDGPKVKIIDPPKRKDQ